MLADGSQRHRSVSGNIPPYLQGIEKFNDEHKRVPVVPPVLPSTTRFSAAEWQRPALSGALQSQRYRETGFRSRAAFVYPGLQTQTLLSSDT